MRLSPVRYRVLKAMFDQGAPIMWTNDEPSQWWLKGVDGLLPPAVCGWIVRKKLAVYDVLLNDAGDSVGGCHFDSVLGIYGLAYTLTEAGREALKHNGPKAVIIPFRKAEQVS